MVRQAFLPGRPALTRATGIAAKGGRRPPPTRRLVGGGLLPSRPQERFRTRPRLLGLGDLEGIILDQAGQIGTEEVPLHHHAAVTGVDAFRESLLVPLPAQADWR
jgi:hypothetical protein